MSWHASGLAQSMNPILVAGVSTLASQLADRVLGNGPSPSRSAGPTMSFRKALESTKDSNISSVGSISDLRQKLLETPEVRDALKQVDLTQVSSLELSQNGSLSIVSTRGQVEIPLSEGSRTIARHLFTQEALNRSAKLETAQSVAAMQIQSPVRIALPLQFSRAPLSA